MIDSACDRLIIIIINAYGAYVTRNLISEAQHNIIIKHNRKQGRAKVIIRTSDNRRIVVEMQFAIKSLLEMLLSSELQ